MRTNLIKKDTKKVSTKVELEDGLLDMVIAFDTTGSMSSYIGDVKNHVKELIPKLLGANPNMRIGIVAFGDYCDMPSAKVFGKAYQCLPLTNDEDQIIEFVTNAENTSGGDSDEFYELVRKYLVNKPAILAYSSAAKYEGLTYREYVKKIEVYVEDFLPELSDLKFKQIKLDSFA